MSEKKLQQSYIRGYELEYALNKVECKALALLYELKGAC